MVLYPVQQVPAPHAVDPAIPAHLLEEERDAGICALDTQIIRQEIGIRWYSALRSALEPTQHPVYFTVPEYFMPGQFHAFQHGFHGQEPHPGRVVLQDWNAHIRHRLIFHRDSHPHILRPFLEPRIWQDLHPLRALGQDQEQVPGASLDDLYGIPSPWVCVLVQEVGPGTGEEGGFLDRVQGQFKGRLG